MTSWHVTLSAYVTCIETIGSLLFPTLSKFWNNAFEVNVVGQVWFNGQERQVTYWLVLGNCWTQLIALEHRKRSFSFRVSDGQCQVNSEGSVDVWKCFRYSVFLNASQISKRWNSFCRILFNVANEVNELNLKQFFFNVTWEMCLEFAQIDVVQRQKMSARWTESQTGASASNTLLFSELIPSTNNLR